MQNLEQTLKSCKKKRYIIEIPVEEKKCIYIKHLNKTAKGRNRNNVQQVENGNMVDINSTISKIMLNVNSLNTDK